MDYHYNKDKVKVIGVIPARYASRRFAGKVIAPLLGKPLIQHVWERARKARLLDELIIACDDERIAAKAREFGAHVVLTAKGHVCGTDRIAEVVNPVDVRIVVNIQGDEPLIHPSMIDDVADVLLHDSALVMATLVKKIDNQRLIDDPHVVKVVIDKDGYALYFSRAGIPSCAPTVTSVERVCYKHIGLYAYTKDFLFTFKNLPVSYLEQIESLEQLRVLESGFRIKTVETIYDTIGVDTPRDIERVEKILLNEKDS